MARRTPMPPARGAIIVAKFYPNTFAWIIRTGPEVNRDALANALETSSPIRYRIENAARSLCDARVQDGANSALITDRMIAKKIRLVRRALRTNGEKYVNDGSHPKGKGTVTTEKLVIRAVLEYAAARVRAGAILSR